MKQSTFFSLSEVVCINRGGLALGDKELHSSAGFPLKA